MLSQIEVNEMRAEVLKLCEKMLAANPRYRPMPPYILVLVFSRGNQVGRIILPDQERRFSGEGLVIDTFRPYECLYTYDTNLHSTKNSDSKPVTKPYTRTCTVSPGDRVIFPSWAGVPTNIDAGMGDFRLLDERNAVATLEVPSETQDSIYKDIGEFFPIVERSGCLEHIKSKYILVPRDSRPYLEPIHSVR